ALRRSNMIKTITIALKATVLGSAAGFVSAACALANGFDWENLQSDIHSVAELTDQNVVNPWGIAHSASETIYVVNNGTGVATEYFEDGTPAPSFANPHIIMIPRSAGNTEGANPTGVVWNSTSSFGVSNGTNTLPANLILFSEDGMISGWNPNLIIVHVIITLD